MALAPADRAKFLADTEALADRSAPAGQGDTGNPAQPTIPTNRETPKVKLDPHVSAEDYEKIGKLLQLFSEARSHRRPIVARWRKSYKMLRNHFWADGRPGWMPSPQIPEIYPIVDALVSWESDQSPRYTIAPKALPHTDFQRFFESMANDLEIVMDSAFVNNAEELEWSKANWDKYVYGTGFVKTTWDMTLAGGAGDATTRRVDPFTFYPDPAATSMTDANYFVEARQMSIQELDRRWPGTARLFPEGGIDHDHDTAPNQLDNGSQGEVPRANPGAISPATTPRYGRPGGARNHATDPTTPSVTVLEFWLREHESYDAVDRQTGDKTTRVIDEWRVVIVAGNRIIMDEPATNLWSHGQHPYDRVVLRDTGEFWGFSLVELLTSAQANYNRMLAALQHNTELTGNPIYKDTVERRGVQITNRPGQRIPGNAQSKDAGWLQPPRIGPEMKSLVEFYLNRMEAIAGLSAVMKGNSPAGRNAQGVIDAIQEAGFVRIRSSLKFLEAAMRDAGAKKADLICENYTQKRLIAIAGPGGERTSLALKSRHFLIPTESGATPLKYQLLVDIGSGRHTSRQMREDRAVQLYTLQAIDRQALLEDVEYPNGAAVSKRMDDREAQMAAMGADASGPGARQRARA